MMDEEQRQELRRIREEQRDLRAQLGTLDQRIFALEGVASKAPAPPAIAKLAPPIAAVPAPPLPTAPTAPVAEEMPPPLPPLPAVAPVPSTPTTPPLIAPSPVFAQEEAKPSLEMQIGSVWLLRAGIFMALTALVFLGTYLYQNVVPHLGPGGKVALLYLAAGALTGVGFFLERGKQARDSQGVLNYARVVLAGGLAGIYYVTYAAHYYEKLRVIDSALLAGALLLGWTAFMTWLADRRNSQALAAFSILLAYYTSATSEVAGFTLFANLGLTVAAVYLVRRRRWTAFSFASLAATFGSYAYWRYGNLFFGGLDAPAVLRSHLWLEGSFLLCYWALFTFAAFFDESQSLEPPTRRASFISLNNAACFVLVGGLVHADYPGSFWKWALLFGVTLIALAEWGRWKPRPLDAHSTDSYHFEGISLVTLGFLLYFNGWQLALVLAVQSATLLAASRRRESWVFLSAAMAVAAGAFLCALNQYDERFGYGASWLNGLSIGAIFIFNGWLSQQWRERTAAPTDGSVQASPPNTFRRMLPLQPGYFSSLGWLLLFVVLEHQITQEVYRAPVTALAAVALAASVYLLRLRSAVFFAQFYLVAAFINWMTAYAGADPAMPPPFWNPLTVIISALAIGHWQQRKASEAHIGSSREILAAISALIPCVLLWFWLQHRFTQPTWAALSGALSLGVLAYGIATDYGKLAVAGQLLLLAGIFAFVDFSGRSSGISSERWLLMVPLLTTLATIAAGRRFLAQNHPGTDAWAPLVSALYEIGALLLFILWVGRYFPWHQQFAIFAWGGAAAFVASCYWREPRWQWLSAIATAAGVFVFTLECSSTERGYFIQLFGILAIAAQQQFGRRWPWQAPTFTPRVQETMMTAATLCGWLWISNRLSSGTGEGTFTLAAGWSVFAAVVFAAGLGLRERVYRWLGLLILACTVGHILIIDIWQLGGLQRILSVFAIALVLLVISFIYARYQAKFKTWF